VGIRRYHLDRDAIRAEHVPSNEIPWADLKGVKIGTVTISGVTVGAGTSVNLTATVSGLTTDHKVIVMCQGDLEAGLVPQAAYVSAADTLCVRLGNPTAADIAYTDKDWFYIAWIP